MQAYLVEALTHIRPPPCSTLGSPSCRPWRAANSVNQQVQRRPEGSQMNSLESLCGMDLCGVAGWWARDPNGWAGLWVGWDKSFVGPGDLCGERLSYEGLGAGAWVESSRGGNLEAPGRPRPQGGRTGRIEGSQRLPSEMCQFSPV